MCLGKRGGEFDVSFSPTVPILLRLALSGNCAVSGINVWWRRIWRRKLRFLCEFHADSGGRAVCGVGLRPLACWDCGFESRRVQGCLSLVSVVCCHVEVSAMGRSLVQRSPAVWDVFECDR